MQPATTADATIALNKRERRIETTSVGDSYRGAANCTDADLAPVPTRPQEGRDLVRGTTRTNSIADETRTRADETPAIPIE
jgi:hypothetical protein